MSRPRSIDNDDPLLFFDPLESTNDLEFPSTSMPVEVGESNIEMGKGKGKAASQPVPIMVPGESSFSTLDAYGVSISPQWSVSSSFHEPPGTPIVASSYATPSSPTFTLGSFTSVWQHSSPESGNAMLVGTSPGGKGKGRANVEDDEIGSPPVIPPLTFSPMNTTFDHAPSSSGISLSYPLSAYIHDSQPAQPTPDTSNAHRTLVSMTDASVLQHSAASSMSKLRQKLGTSSPSSLTRKLLSKKVPDSDVLGASSSTVITQPLDIGVSNLTSDEPFIADVTTFHGHLKVKGRSNSSPYPPSILDIVPSQDVFLPIAIPIPFKPPRNHFDEKLPRELKLKVLQSLVVLYESEHQTAIDNGQWTALRAASSKNRWVGRDRAISHLARLSRVSKTWQALVFDGQLWASLDLRSFPALPKSLLSRLAGGGGQFTTVLNVSGHTHLNASTLLDITDKLTTILPTNDSVSTANASTRLTTINLRGCSSVNTRSLHHLLVRSPLLERLYVKGLPVVTNTTCDILAMYCPNLISLDVSRCPHIDAEGVTRMLCAHEWSEMKELHMSGLKHVSDKTMSALAKAVPNLEVLDLTDARQVHNTAVQTFVRALDGQPSVEYSADGTKTTKRVTKLRHVSLSGCHLLTDGACTHLAGAVPALEIFEMAGIGEDLKDEGVMKLLETTPLIRKVDLEDACDVTDALLAVLTPATEDPMLQDGDSSSVGGSPESQRRVATVPEPGYRLEHLVLSYASRITDEALNDLIRRCPRLRALEVDNTRVGSNVIKTFVEAARKRGIKNSLIAAVDCRLVGETVVREMSSEVRPRMGWRSWDARKLKFFDARDFATRSDNLSDSEITVKEHEKEKEAIVKIAMGQDELDENRVALKTFYSWQNVDAVWAAREKRNRKRKANASNDSELTDSEADVGGGGSSSRRGGTGRGVRWWSPGGRRSRPGSGTNSPSHLEMNGNDGCVIM
ncbi:hypothetical protein V5O48_001312 [Marasmius crinis-equi]|uniref:RNI-like protein n=1 Tax=Marasmius crinis-equi TaxID=585013 RepID=A0ABR3FYP2_9AGAR